MWVLGQTGDLGITRLCNGHGDVTAVSTGPPPVMDLELSDPGCWVVLWNGPPTGRVLVPLLLCCVQQDRPLNRFNSNRPRPRGIGDSRLLTCLCCTRQQYASGQVVFLLYLNCRCFVTRVSCCNGRRSSVGVPPRPGLCPPVVRLFHRQLRSGLP